MRTGCSGYFNLRGAVARNSRGAFFIAYGKSYRARRVFGKPDCYCELLAFNLLRENESSAMQEFLSQLVMRYFQRSTDAESRQQHLRDKLNELKDK